MSQNAPEKQKSSAYNSMIWREILRDCLMQWWGAGKSELHYAAGRKLAGFLWCSLEEDSLFRTAQFLKAFNGVDDTHHILEGNLSNSKSTDFNIYLLKVPQFKCQPRLKMSLQK